MIVLFWFSVGFRIFAFFEVFSIKILGFKYSHPDPYSTSFLRFFSGCWLVAAYCGQWASFSVFFPMAQTSNYATGLWTAHTSQKTISLLWFLFFQVLNPYRLLISFVAFIRIVCCLNIYSTYITSNHANGYFWGCLDKCNRDCNRDYFQRNRNRFLLRFCLFVVVMKHVTSTFVLYRPMPESGTCSHHQTSLVR